jgi:hypothetical protein
VAWGIARRACALDRAAERAAGEGPPVCAHACDVATPLRRVAPRAMHARTCALQGASAGASTCVLGPLSGGRHLPSPQLASRTTCRRACVVTAASGDDTPAAVPRRTVLATPPALLLAVAASAAVLQQPGAAVAASRRLKAPAVDQYLTLPVRCVLTAVSLSRSLWLLAPFGRRSKL